MTIVLSDDFTGTNGTTLTGRLAPVGGQTWETPAGTWEIQSNRATNVSGSNGTALIDTGMTDYEVSAVINYAAGTNLPGLVFAAESNSSRLGIYLNTGDDRLEFWSSEGGAVHTVSATLDPGVDYTVRIHFVDGLVEAYLDGAVTPTLTYDLTPTERSTYLDGTHTKVGFRGRSNYDTLSVDDLATGPVVKEGSDTATGTEAGSVSATATGSDSATGTETGSIAVVGGDTATGSESGYVAEGRDGGDTATGSETGGSSATIASGDTATGTDTGGSTAAITPPADTATGTEGGHIAIPGGDSATGTDTHVPPTLVTVTSGDSAVGSEGGYVEELFGDLIINLYGIDPDDGSLVALPDYVALNFSRERNSRGAISLEYPVGGKSFDLLRSTVTTSRDLEIELWTNGTPAGALRGYLQEASGDDVAEGAVWTFAGGFLELRADETVVFPQSRGSLITDPDTGEKVWTNPRRELIFNADTPGAVAATLLDQATARGALTDITRDFTTTHDSNGTPWPGVLTAKFSPGVTYTQILDKLVDLHLAEWAIVWTGSARVLKLWAAEGRGADLTLGPRPVILRRGRNLLDAPRDWSVRDAGTTLLAAGDEGIYEEASDATALARRGRRIERFASLNNAADDEAVLAFAQAELATITAGLLSISHGIGMLPGEPRPIIAFDIGDWVFSQVDTTTERLRVVQWELSIDSNRQLSGKVALNDTVRDAVERLRERLNAISSGEAVVGTSEPPPGGEDTTPPAMPEGLAATSIAYQDPDHGPGQTLAMVSVGWLPVTTNADGSNSPFVQAAVLILDKMEEPDPDPPLQPDWTWEECPQVVRDFAAGLQDLWILDGSPDAETWLAGFIAEETQTPTAADDVAGYNVRYSYLGLEQVGGIPSSDPFPEAERFYYEATPPQGISSTNYDFGGVEGGARLRIEARAFDRAGNYGPWATISHDCANDNTPPPVPSGPVGFKAWFRTLDIPWDGRGSEGEPMPHDFSHVRVWVGQGADMTLPPEPVGDPTEFNPAETAPQYVAQLFGGGTWNLPDVPLGVGWYARLQAVDRTGNASAGSTVAGPVFVEQLVSQDLIDDIITSNLLGPDSVENQHVVNGAITTAKIVDAAIVNAKIANLAVNDAKIETLSVGKLTTGTMTATVTVTGSLWTSTDPNATRLGFSGAGLQLYRTNAPSGGSTLVGEWRTSDGSMLVTGTYRSALSGQRIHIDPDGSFRLYPPSGTNFSQITNAAGEAVWRGPLDGNGRSGRVNVNILGVGINFSNESEIPNNLRSEILLVDRQVRTTAAFTNLQVDERQSNPVSGSRRIQFSHINSSGNFITRSGISYFVDSNDWGGIAGNDTGWKLAGVGPGGDGRFVVTGGTLSGSGVGLAFAWETTSSRDLKEEIEDARAVLDPRATVKAARAKKWRFIGQRPDAPVSIGVVAEDLPEVLRREITLDGVRSLAVDQGSLNGVLWGALNQIFDQEIVATSGTVTFSTLTVGNDTNLELDITWDSKPPTAPTGGFVQVHSPWAGRITGWIKTGSVTQTGCTVVFKNVAKTELAYDEVAATVIGLGLYTPPYIPPEEA